MGGRRVVDLGEPPQCALKGKYQKYTTLYYTNEMHSTMSPLQDQAGQRRCAPCGDEDEQEQDDGDGDVYGVGGGGDDGDGGHDDEHDGDTTDEEGGGDAGMDGGGHTAGWRAAGSRESHAC
mmetsp:Transcript_58632/g.154067  ORF Transcript_58632/g.154067 Transcript_58632/m.154067 type:complete len:121 (-) Transcript_58632:663-1025(-)